MSNENQIHPLKRWDLRLAIILSVFAIISYLIGGCEKLNEWREEKKKETPELVDLNRIIEIEKSVTPTYNKSGVAKHSDIVDYYYEANTELKSRLKSIVEKTKNDKNYESISYVPAPAGYGKSWIGHKICKLEIPENQLTIISLKDNILKKDSNYVVNNFDIIKTAKPDLIISNITTNSKIIINELDYFDEPFSKVLNIEGKPKKYVLIDDLDEVHPETSTKILTQIQKYVDSLQKPPINFIILGRAEAFYPYINNNNKDKSNADIKILNSMVSPSYSNYEDVKMRFNNWIGHVSKKRAIPQIVKDSTEIYNGLMKYLDKYPYLRLSFTTAANSGNIIDYAISEHLMTSEYGLENEKILRELLTGGVLKRNKDTHRRPAAGSLNYEEYNMMIAEIAKEFYTNGLMEEQWFSVPEGKELTINMKDKQLKFNVRNVLDRSGLVDIKPTPTEYIRYKFEPFWLHRYYLEYYNEEQKKIIKEKNTTANRVGNVRHEGS